MQPNITITVKNNTKNETGTWTTNSVGEYAASLSDPAQFPSGYDVGDSVTVSCNFASKTIEVPVGAGWTVGGMTVNLIRTVVTIRPSVFKLRARKPRQTLDSVAEIAVPLISIIRRRRRN